MWPACQCKLMSSSKAWKGGVKTATINQHISHRRSASSIFSLTNIKINKLADVTFKITLREIKYCSVFWKIISSFQGLFATFRKSLWRWHTIIWSLAWPCKDRVFTSHLRDNNSDHYKSQSPRWWCEARSLTLTNDEQSKSLIDCNELFLFVFVLII